MSWAWHLAWTHAALPQELQASFAIALLGPQHDVQALLPFRVRSMPFRRQRVRMLTWAAGGIGAPDHLDIPAAPDAPFETLVPTIEALPWDLVLLTGIGEEATNVGKLADAFALRGYSVRRALLDVCPCIDLPATWEDYLATLTRSRRQTIRWSERRLRRDHTVAVTDYVPGRFAEGWSHLRALHLERWSGGGSLGDPLVGRLVQRFSEELAAAGQLWLTTLDVDGEPAAAWCGFAYGDTVFFYQSGRATKWDSSSVGQVLLGIMIRRAIEAGYRRFDFLRGRDPYKLSWASTERPIYEIVIFRRGVRGTWLRGIDLAGRARARLRARPEFAGTEACALGL